MATVFLSYSRTDQAFVDELYRRLTRDGVACFFDKVSIAWGENFVRALETALDESDVIVAVLSPEFCASEWVTLERTSAMLDDPAGLRRRVRPLLRRTCDTLPRFLRPLQQLDVSTDHRFDVVYPQLCRDLGGSPRKERPRSAHGALPPEQQLASGSRMARRSMGDRFVGRVDDLWTLHDLLFARDVAVVSGVAAIAGTGGLGKTQLAIEYVRRFGDLYPGGVWWVEADQGLGAVIARVADASQVAIDGTRAEPDQAAQLWDALRGRPTSLLVLDNVPEQIALEAYLPASSAVQALVTTRRRDLNQPTLPLSILDPEAALALLNTGDRTFGPDAHGLLEALGRLPLAIELTRSFLNHRKDFAPPTLLAEMHTAGEMHTLKRLAERYGDELPSGHELDVVTTFKMSWDLLNESATRTGAAIAALAPAPVPVRLLRSIAGMQYTGLDDPLGDAISELERLSLAERDAEGHSTMHRLVRAFVRHITPQEHRSDEVVQREMERVKDRADKPAYHELDQVVPHAEMLAHADGVTAVRKVELWNCVGTLHQEHGRYVRAQSALARALREAEAAFEPGHPAIATSQSSLAGVLQDLGELPEARDLLRQLSVFLLAVEIHGAVTSSPSLGPDRGVCEQAVSEVFRSSAEPQDQVTENAAVVARHRVTEVSKLAGPRLQEGHYVHGAGQIDVVATHTFIDD